MLLYGKISFALQIHSSLHAAFDFREYLLGFRKRKNERRKKAQDDLTKKEKERRKELKQEVCLQYHIPATKFK